MNRPEGVTIRTQPDRLDYFKSGAVDPFASVMFETCTAKIWDETAPPAFVESVRVDAAKLSFGDAVRFVDPEFGIETIVQKEGGRA